MHARSTVVSAALLALATLGTALPSIAQDWPTKAVRVIVPFPPGGGTDTVARPLMAKLSQLTGQQFVIDNRGGAGGTIGAAAAARATPDGYTVLLSPVHVAVASRTLIARTLAIGQRDCSIERGR